MPRYGLRIEQHVHYWTEVEAESAQDAENKIASGDWDDSNNTVVSDSVHVETIDGQPAAELRELERLEDRFRELVAESPVHPANQPTHIQRAMQTVTDVKRLRQRSKDAEIVQRAEALYRRIAIDIFEVPEDSFNKGGGQHG